MPSKYNDADREAIGFQAGASEKLDEQIKKKAGAWQPEDIAQLVKAGDMDAAIARMVAAGYCKTDPTKATVANAKSFLLEKKKVESHFLKKLMANKAVFEVVQKDLKSMLDVDIDQNTDLADIERFYDQAMRVRDRAKQKLQAGPKKK